MLVIGRFSKESVILRNRETGARIAEITLIQESRYGKSRLGITADQSVAVYRAEIDPGDPPDKAAGDGRGNPEQNEPS